MKHNLLLYIGGGCPFCIKVTDFMKIHDIQIPTVDVWKDNTAKQDLLQLTGKTQVPCLKIDEDGMLESDDIIKKLSEIYDL